MFGMRLASCLLSRHSNQHPDIQMFRRSLWLEVRVDLPDCPKIVQCIHIAIIIGKVILMPNNCGLIIKARERASLTICRVHTSFDNGRT